jgi:hypothetical protein
MKYLVHYGNLNISDTIEANSLIEARELLKLKCKATGLDHKYFTLLELANTINPIFEPLLNFFGGIK